MDSVDSRFLLECCIIDSVDSTGRTNGITSVAVANHVYIDGSLLTRLTAQVGPMVLPLWRLPIMSI